MRHRALGAKACHPDQRFGRLCNQFLPKTLRFSLQRHKTAKSCAFCDCTPEFYGGILYWLLEKQGKLYFLQSSQTKGRGVLLPPLQPWFVKDTAFFFAKAQNSRIRRSRILGLYAGFLFYQRLVWGFGLGLLGGQGFIGAKASLDPLCRALWHRALFWHRALLLPSLQPWFVKETAFFFAKAQNSGIRGVPDSGTGCRFYTQSFVYTQSFTYWHRKFT